MSDSGRDVPDDCPLIRDAREALLVACASGSRKRRPEDLEPDEEMAICVALGARVEVEESPERPGAIRFTREPCVLTKVEGRWTLVRRIRH